MWHSNERKRSKGLPKISEAEWVVMKVVWAGGPQTTSRIVTELKQTTDWKPQTIHTLLARLVQKGALAVEKRGREHAYRAQVTDEECEHAISHSFLHRFFDGQLSSFVARFVEREKLSAAEIEELRKILTRSKR